MAKGKKRAKWLEDVILQRMSNKTNAFIFPTIDKVRWLQIRNLALDDFQKLYVDTQFSVYEWDPVENRIVKFSVEERDGKPTVVGQEYILKTSRTKDGATITTLVEKQNPHEIAQMSDTVLATLTWKHFVRMMRLEPTIVIVKATAFTTPGKEAYAKLMDNMVGVVSRDPAIFKNNSSLFIITPSLGYFSEVSQKLSKVADIPVAEEEERRERLEILTKVLKERKILKEDVKVSEDLVKATAGLNLDEVESATLVSAYKYADLRVEAYTQYKIDMLKSYGIEYVEPTYGFEKVGGYDYLKEFIQKKIVDVLRRPDISVDYGGEEELPRGLILHGLPGTGKTYFAHALAKELGLPVVKLSPADFLRGIVGETEQRIKQITKVIDSISPAVVFIDEIDQLAMDRSAMVSTDSGVSKRMINMLLTWLGDPNRKAFIVGATNLLPQMDKAFIRPGRFDKIVYVPPPDMQGRYEILKLHMLDIHPINTKKIKFNPDILWEVAKRTELWTGAELMQLCKNVKATARENRAKEITLDDFLEELKWMEIDVEGRREEIASDLRMMKEKFKSGAIDLKFLSTVEKQLGLGAMVEIDENARVSKKKTKFVEGYDIGGWGI